MKIRVTVRHEAGDLIAERTAAIEVDDSASIKDSCIELFEAIADEIRKDEQTQARKRQLAQMKVEAAEPVMAS